MEAKVNTNHRKIMILLIFACKEGSETMAKCLIENGANVNTV